MRSSYLFASFAARESQSESEKREKSRFSLSLTSKHSRRRRSSLLLAVCTSTTSKSYCELRTAMFVHVNMWICLKAKRNARFSLSLPSRLLLNVLSAVQAVVQQLFS